MALSLSHHGSVAFDSSVEGLTEKLRSFKALSLSHDGSVVFDSSVEGLTEELRSFMVSLSHDGSVVFDSRVEGLTEELRSFMARSLSHDGSVVFDSPVEGENLKDSTTVEYTGGSSRFSPSSLSPMATISAAQAPISSYPRLSYEGLVVGAQQKERSVPQEGDRRRTRSATKQQLEQQRQGVHVEDVTSSMVEARLKKRSAPQESCPGIKQQEQQQKGTMKEQVKDTESIYSDAEGPFFGYRHMNKEEEEEYKKMVEKSKGFHVGPLPNGGKIIGRGIIRMIYSKTDKDCDDKRKAMIVTLAESGIACYNEGNQGPKYKFVELIKVNMCSSHGRAEYYITFLAKNTSGFKRFQALVWCVFGYANKHSTVHFCDLEPASESH